MRLATPLPCAATQIGSTSTALWTTPATRAAIGTCLVRIDTTRPKPKAPYRASTRRGHWVTVRFSVNDWAQSGTATATLRFKTGKGRTVKTVLLTRQKVNTALKYRFRCLFGKGTYRFFIYSTDIAGNTQLRPASNTLMVR